MRTLKRLGLTVLIFVLLLVIGLVFFGITFGVGLIAHHYTGIDIKVGQITFLLTLLIPLIYFAWAKKLID